jgi:hypothetical protein
MRSTSLLLGTAALTLLLAGCGSSDITDTSTATAASTGSSASGGSPSAAPSDQPAGDATILQSGFGQEGEYVWVTSVVHNGTGKVGQTVTVQYNVLDDAGDILASESQVEAFSILDQDLAVGTQVSLDKGVKVSKVEATLLVEDNGTFDSTPRPPIPTTPGKVAKDEYGNWGATFIVSNPLSEPLKDARIGIVCYDAAKAIIGGGVSFPDLIPAGGKVKIDPTTLLISGKPDACTAYAGHGF